MPWKKMRLRDAEVLVRVHDSGEPAARGGRVEIRYNPTSPKAYQAGVGNLSPVAGAPLHPDDHCADLGAPAGVPAKGSARGGTARAVPAVPAGAITVYADGACSGNPGPAGLGVVLIDGLVRLERSEYLGQGTNNIAELTAVLRALEMLPAPDRDMVIHTDSQYSIGVLSLGWKAKANPELIARLRAVLATRPKVRFVHVRGHAGVPLNERADELARQAVTSRRTEQKEYRSAPPGSQPDSRTD